jgi:hypothetical protein
MIFEGPWGGAAACLAHPSQGGVQLSESAIRDRKLLDRQSLRRGALRVSTAKRLVDPLCPHPASLIMHSLRASAAQNATTLTTRPPATSRRGAGCVGQGIQIFGCVLPWDKQPCVLDTKHRAIDGKPSGISRRTTSRSCALLPVNTGRRTPLTYSLCCLDTP